MATAWNNDDRSTEATTAAFLGPLNFGSIRFNTLYCPAQKMTLDFVGFKKCSWANFQGHCHACQVPPTYNAYRSLLRLLFYATLTLSSEAKQYIICIYYTYYYIVHTYLCTYKNLSSILFLVCNIMNCIL